MPRIRVILGSKSDLAACEPLKQVLEEFAVDYDFHVSSAHRKPENTARLAQNAEAEGVQLIIAAAGMAFKEGLDTGEAEADNGAEQNA